VFRPAAIKGYIMSKIIYEPHPVTPERKRELREQGYTIVDAVYAPDDYMHPDAQKQGAKGKKAEA
jgi:hypothetical protein